MTRLTHAELAALKLSNPDIVVVTDEDAFTTAQPRQRAVTWSEHDLQEATIVECDRRAQTDSRYACLFAIPNGGARDKVTGGKLKAEGVRAGVPDLFLAVPSGMFAGLFLELKVKPNRPRTNQMEWMQRLRQRGYKVVVCYDTVQSVIDAIESYLEES